MPISDLYERIKNSVLRQEVDGTYVRKRPHDSYVPLFYLGILNAVAGAAALATYLTVHTHYVGYESSTTESVPLRKGTNYLYIDVDNFYQNYLSYTKSISRDQIDGETRNLNLSNCSPFDYYMKNIPYYPAGAIASTYFQDAYRIEGLDIESDNISWKNEREQVGETGYQAEEIAMPEGWTETTNQGTVPLNTSEDSGIPIINERFVNWMFLSSFPNFRKLWGRVEAPESGDYSLEIESVFDYSKKGVFFTQRCFLGMPNYFLPGVLIAIGLVCIFSSYFINRLH